MFSLPLSLKNRFHEHKRQNLFFFFLNLNIICNSYRLVFFFAGCCCFVLSSGSFFFFKCKYLFKLKLQVTMEIVSQTTDLVLIRYCASATDSVAPVMVIVRSVLLSRSSQLEIRIMAPLICLKRVAGTKKDALKHGQTH